MSRVLLFIRLENVSFILQLMRNIMGMIHLPIIGGDQKWAIP